MDRIYKSAQIIAIIFGVFTPFILLAGYVYYLGYITAFGLDYSLMNRGFGEVIAESWYMGLIVLAYLLPIWWYPFVLILFLLALALAVLYLVVKLRARGIDIVPQEITKENQGRTTLGFTQWHWVCWRELIEETSSWVVIAIAIFLFAIAVTFFPYQYGNSEALKRIEQYQTVGCEVSGIKPSPARCVDLVDISSPSVPIAQGFLVTANTERVAIFNKNGLEVWPILDSYVLRKSYYSAVETTGTNE